MKLSLSAGSRVGWWLTIPAFAATSLWASAMPPASEAAWQHIEQLRQQLAQEPPKGVNAIEFSAPTKAELHADSTEFTTRYPDDPHRWDAELLELKTIVFPTPVAERRVSFDQQEKLLAEILASPGASAEVKQNAERSILFQHLDHLDLIDTPTQAAALEARLTDFIARHPSDSKANALQVRRLDLLQKADPAKAAALLASLSTSTDPKVADAARGRQEQQALANTPLDWKFNAVDGTPVDLAQWRGKYVLVDFWASWCPDCLREMPDVLAAYRQYHRRGLEVIGVSLDDDHDALTAFTKKHVMPWPQFFDGQGYATPYAAKYGVRGIPEMWLVDKSGRVAAAGLHGSQLDARLAPLFAP